MLEFVLILPFLFFIVAGLIDYGNVVRQLNTLSFVSRDAARRAAAHARTARVTTPGEPRVLCERASTPLDSIACDAPANVLQIREYESANPSQTPDSVEIAGKKAACLSLRSANLNPADFDVVPRIRRAREVPGNPATYGPLILRLRIELKPDRRNCLLCWGNLLAQVPLRGESSFVLEDECRAETPGAEVPDE